MKVVIEISERDYKTVINDIDLQVRDKLARAIADGIVLDESSVVMPSETKAQ